jgi:hypothetical protein
VAPLTTAARAVRVDAARLRSEAQSLRFAIRGSRARSREGLDRAQIQIDRARASRALRCGSPWSSLEWSREGGQLGRVLVPLD